MSPDVSKEQPSFDLPPPAPENAGSLPNPELAAPPGPAGELPQRAELPQSTPPPLPVTNDPVSSDGMLAGSPIAPAASTATPPAADDADLIEKEWVEIAKAIVEHTKEDPYKQNQELTKFKADYIKKRYNKDLPVT